MQDDRQEADPSDPDVAIVLDAYEAFARGDIDASVTYLHPQVEWEEPVEFPNGGRRQGPDAVAAYLRGARAMWASLRSEPTVYRHRGNLVVLHHASGWLIDGTEHEVTVADVYTFSDGVVVRMHAYANPDDAFRSSLNEER